jgi:hypothetical protein
MAGVRRKQTLGLCALLRCIDRHPCGIEKIDPAKNPRVSVQGVGA